jgi:hypothetical protein
MRLLLLLFLLPVFWSSLAAQQEADYISTLAAHLGAQKEVSVTSGRVDLLTTTHAIEVERAAKWKNSIGQALWYGLQTNLKPGIILIIQSPEDRKYTIQLGSALRYAGIEDQVRVWIYPDDFPGVVVEEPRAAPNDDPSLTHWLNLNGNKRHNSSCRYFGKTSRGRYCTASEGIAAGCCSK